MRDRSLQSALAVSLLAVALMGAACQTANEAPQELVAQMASYDLAAGERTRVIVGLLTKEGEVLAPAQTRMSFFFVEGAGAQTPEPGPTVQAVFLEIPREEGHVQELPEGFGVYSAPVEFPKAGLWEVRVENRAGVGKAVFKVLEEHRFPAVGDPALLTENLTDASDAPREAIDSRALDGAPIPDPELHKTTIKQAVEAKRPALVVFATPTYCISRFCGPVTDMVQELSNEYGDRAAFIHIEIWRDNRNGVINKSAADWLYRDDDLLEPWVFLIGADGKIAARWDNVATRGEVEPLLKALPRYTS